MTQAFNLPASPQDLQLAIQEVLKSMDGGGYNNYSGGTDALQVGSSALRPENLDHSLKTLSFEDDQCEFWKQSPKHDSKTIVAEAATKNNLRKAGFYGDGGLPAAFADYYKRLVVNLKFIGVQGKVTGVAINQDLIQPAIALETEQKTKSLIWGIEIESLFGNSVVNPLSFDGIFTQHANTIGAFASQNVIDKKGDAITIEDYSTAARIVADNYGNRNRLVTWMGYGHLDKMNQTLGANKQYQVNVAGPVGGVGVGYGLREGDGIINPLGRPITIKTDVFMSNGRTLEVDDNNTSVAVGTTPPNAPAIASATAANDATSKLPKSTVYRYYVCAVGADGISAATTADVTTDGTDLQKVTVTITKNVSGAAETGYHVWRLKNPASNPLSKAVLIASVAAPVGVNVAVVDLGAVYDGCSNVIVMDWDKDIFRMEVLLYMQKFGIASLGDYVAWIQRSYLTPFLLQPRKVVVFKNVKSFDLA